MTDSKINMKLAFFLAIIISLFLFLGFIGGMIVLKSPSNTEIVEVPENNPDKVINNSNYEKLYNEVRPSTVSIYTSIKEGSTGEQGSGFLYSKNGYIVTNQHVLGDSKDVWVQFKKEDWVEGEVVGTDIYTDLGVVKVKEVPNYSKPLPVSETLPEEGEFAFAIGSPYNLRGSITTGVISGLNRSMTTEDNFVIPDVVQTDATLNRGNSGGPLINRKGEVVGINRAKQGASIGFAISPRLINRVVPSLITNGEHHHPYIGIAGSELNPEKAKKYNVKPYNGIVVEEVVENGPASGKLYGNSTYEENRRDILIKVDGIRIQSNEDLSSYLMRKKSPNEKINAEILRNNTRKTIEITLGNRSDY